MLENNKGIFNKSRNIFVCVNLRKIENGWDQIEEKSQLKIHAGNNFCKGEDGFKDASVPENGGFQRSFRKSSGATDRVMRWGSAQKHAHLLTICTLAVQCLFRAQAMSHQCVGL